MLVLILILLLITEPIFAVKRVNPPRLLVNKGIPFTIAIKNGEILSVKSMKSAEVCQVTNDNLIIFAKTTEDVLFAITTKDKQVFLLQIVVTNGLTNLGTFVLDVKENKSDKDDFLTVQSKNIKEENDLIVLSEKESNDKKTRQIDKKIDLIRQVYANFDPLSSGEIALKKLFLLSSSHPNLYFSNIKDEIFEYDEKSYLVRQFLIVNKSNNKAYRLNYQDFERFNKEIITKGKVVLFFWDSDIIYPKQVVYYFLVLTFWD